MQDCDPQQTFWARRREWLPGTLVFWGLLGVAKAAQVADHNLWWFRGHYDLLSLTIFTCFIGAFCVGCRVLFRFTAPPISDALSRRLFSTVFFAGVGFKVGCRYIHLCMAGSRVIETLAMFGTPVLAGAVVFTFKNRVLGYVLATGLLGIVWLLARPYLDWAHGN